MPYNLREACQAVLDEPEEAKGGASAAGAKSAAGGGKQVADMEYYDLVRKRLPEHCHCRCFAVRAASPRAQV
eukprot:SAG11_NODE_387_length_9883_cov_9.365699_7_plen_72_part_00